MSSSLYNLLPMLFFLSLSQFTYVKMDKKHNLTKRLSLKLHIEEQSMAFYCFSCLLLFILFMLLLEFFVVKIPSPIYFSIGGLITGITNGMNNVNFTNQI